MVLPIGNIYHVYSHCKGRFLICPRQKLTCNGAYFTPESRGKRAAKALPKVTSLPVYHSSTSVIHVYHERRMEPSKEARLWTGTELALTGPDACSLSMLWFSALCIFHNN